MPQLETSNDESKKRFRDEMFQNFLNSDYWEAELSPIELNDRFSRYCCDVFYELIEEQKDAL